MKTTIAKIIENRPCKSGLEILLKALFPDNNVDPAREIDFRQILFLNGISDVFWAMRTLYYAEYCLVLADICESMLNFFEPNIKILILQELQIIRDYEKKQDSFSEIYQMQEILYNVHPGDDAIFAAVNALRPYYRNAALNVFNYSVFAAKEKGERIEQIAKNTEILMRYLKK